MTCPTPPSTSLLVLYIVRPGNYARPHFDDFPGAGCHASAKSTRKHGTRAGPARPTSTTKTPRHEEGRGQVTPCRGAPACAGAAPCFPLSGSMGIGAVGSIVVGLSDRAWFGELNGHASANSMRKHGTWAGPARPTSTTKTPRHEEGRGQVTPCRGAPGEPPCFRPLGSMGIGAVGSIVVRLSGRVWFGELNGHASANSMRKHGTFPPMSLTHAPAHAPARAPARALAVPRNVGPGPHGIKDMRCPACRFFFKARRADSVWPWVTAGNPRNRHAAKRAPKGRQNA